MPAAKTFVLGYVLVNAAFVLTACSSATRNRQHDAGFVSLAVASASKDRFESLRDRYLGPSGGGRTMYSVRGSWSMWFSSCYLFFGAATRELHCRQTGNYKTEPERIRLTQYVGSSLSRSYRPERCGGSGSLLRWRCIEWTAGKRTPVVLLLTLMGDGGRYVYNLAVYTASQGAARDEYGEVSVSQPGTDLVRRSYTMHQELGNSEAMSGKFDAAISDWELAAALDEMLPDDPDRKCRGEAQRVQSRAAEEAKQRSARDQLTAGDMATWFEKRDTQLWVPNPCNRP